MKIGMIGSFSLGRTVLASLTILTPTLTGATLTTLETFSSSVGNLVMDKKGILYGTTSGGGLGYGTVFELKPPATKGGAWTQTVIHSFTGFLGYAVNPTHLVLDKNGVLYGTIWGEGSGVGTVFELKPPKVEGGAWTHTVIHSFTGTGSDGGYPGRLVLDKGGILYGTTQGTPNEDTGCAIQGCGKVFQLVPSAVPGGSWTLTVLHTFTPSEGMWPVGDLVIDKHGALYGWTDWGGTDYGKIFRLMPPAASGGAWSFAVLYAFTSPATFPALPQTSLVMDETEPLYGTTVALIPPATVFQLTPQAVPGEPWTFTVLHEFTENTLMEPPGLEIDKKGGLYGTTPFGGDLGYGTVFQLTRPAARRGDWTETVLYAFTGGTDGAYPQGPGGWNNSGIVIGKQGKLYGATYNGSSGTVYELIP
jgi:hypothetical protein